MIDNKNMYNSSRPFEYSSSNLWGPSKVIIHGWGLGFLIMIDHFSNRVWLHILKHKSDIFEKFKECHTFIRNQLEAKVEIVRTDNGLKFVSK